MLFAMFYLNWVGIFGSLFAAALLIAGLIFGLRLMKVSHAPAWTVACVAVLGAIFAGRGGGETVVLLLLFGVPLIGAAVYLAVKLTSPKQVGIAAAVGLFVVIFLFLLRSNSQFELENREHVRATEQMHDALMNEQAVRVRALREDIDRRQRDLFDSQVSKSRPKDVTAAGPSPSDEQVETLKSSSGVAWYPEVDERFDTDIQPSMEATGRALGQKLVPLVKHVTSQGTDPELIRIHGPGLHESALRAFDDLASVMRRRYPDAQVLVEKVSLPQPATGISGSQISIRVENSNLEYKTRNGKSEIESTHFTAYMRGWVSTGVTVSVTMVDKSWVHDFDEFVSSDRNGGLLVDGRSGRLATSRSDAHDAAIDDAVSLLTPVATEVLKAQKHLLIRAPDEEDIAARLKQELLAGQLIVDTFSQQLAHPMGNLWREAVLVRVDYPWLERVFSTYLQQRQKVQRDRLSLGAALTLLAIGIIVLHALLNWITKGYHRKSVGVLSALFAICGVALVVIIALKLGFGGYGKTSIKPTRSTTFSSSSETGRPTL